MRIIVVNEFDINRVFKPYRDAIEAGLSQAAEEIKAEMLKPTTTWSKAPQVDIKVEPFKREISTGDGRYVMLDEGTKKHSISPRNKRFLKFRDRIAKTRPASFDAGPGGQGDEIYFAKKVNNPGVTPRNWALQIQFDYGDFYGGGKLAKIIQNKIDGN